MISDANLSQLISFTIGLLKIVAIPVVVAILAILIVGPKKPNR